MKNGKQAFKDLELEFDGVRAYVVWDTVPVGSYQLKARLEINPALLMKSGGRGCDFFYQGALVLPRPELN